MSLLKAVAFHVRPEKTPGPGFVHKSIFGQQLSNPNAAPSTTLTQEPGSTYASGWTLIAITAAVPTKARAVKWTHVCVIHNTFILSLPDLNKEMHFNFPT